jgi:tetratricopeptide (TPR) repeat protein
MQPVKTANRRDLQPSTPCVRFKVSGRGFLFLCLLPALLNVTRPLSADRLLLDNGRTVQGAIQQESGERVTILTPEGLMSFAPAQIKELVRETPDENRLLTIRLAFSRGNIRDAISLLPRGPEHRGTADLDTLLVRNAESIVRASATLTETDLAGFLSYVNNRPTSAPGQLLLTLAQLQHARGNMAGALDQLGKINPPDLSQSHIGLTAARLIIVECVTQQLAVGDPDAALETLSRFVRILPDTATSETVALGLVKRAESAARDGDYSGALSRLIKEVAPLAPVTAFNASKQLLRTAERDTTGSALAALYEMVDESYCDPLFEHDLAAMCRKHARLLVSIGKFDGADRVAARLSALDADSGAALAHEVEFARRHSVISPGDDLAHYRLGVWATEMAMPDAARKQFQKVIRNPDLKPNAELQLRLLALQGEKAQLAGAQRLFDSGKYGDAIRMATELRERFPDGELRKQAGDLIEVARYRTTHSDAHPAAGAAALFQNAERLFLQERYPEALETANRVIVDYSGTEAARMASDLRTRVLKKLPAGAESTTGVMERQLDLEASKIAEIRRLIEGLTGKPLSH